MNKKSDLTPPEKKEVTEWKTSPCIVLREDEKGKMIIEIEQTLLKFIGTDDNCFTDVFIRQLVNAGMQGHNVNDEGPNFMLSVVKGIEPRDQIEAMLASQMAAVQMAIMTFARRLAHVDKIPQQDSTIQGFTKLTRCFTAQMEALKKYRSNGQQKVTVEHVTVNDGGQAIVGNVGQEGGGYEKRN